MCLKETYQTKKDAKKAIHLLKKLNAVGAFKKGKVIKRKFLRVYQCDVCGKYHLTSQK